MASNDPKPRSWNLRKRFVLGVVFVLWATATLRWSSEVSGSFGDANDALANQHPARPVQLPIQDGKNHSKEITLKNREEHRQEQEVAQDDNAKENDLPASPSKAARTNKHKLRFDWTNLPVQSPLAKDMVAHQNNCSLPLSNFKFRNRFGLGSDLHVWGQGLCNAFEASVRSRTKLPWIFLDEEACKDYADKKSSMLCYFPTSELNCPGDVEQSAKDRIGKQEQISFSPSNGCTGLLAKYNGELGIPDIRAAGIEFLFREISPVLLAEAERQLNLVFPDGVPEGLITVHMRWGDKKQEMKLRKVGDYINAVKKILKKRKVSVDKAHIFLATEDPEAVKQFTEEMPEGWKLYVDQFYTEMLPYRIDEYNGNPKMSRQLKGKTGLIALGSLLVSVESNCYVLTTASNWSRLMNELRKNVIDPRCKNCTIMIDLKEGEW